MQERRVERGQVVDSPEDGYVEERTERVVQEPSGRVMRSSAEYAPAPPAAAVDEVHATAYDPYANRRRSSYKLVQGIWLLFGIVEGILAIRFIDSASRAPCKTVSTRNVSAIAMPPA